MAFHGLPWPLVRARAPSLPLRAFLRAAPCPARRAARGEPSLSAPLSTPIPPLTLPPALALFLMETQAHFSPAEHMTELPHGDWIDGETLVEALSLTVAKQFRYSDLLGVAPGP